MGKIRQSNFELMRIFAMLLIIAHHFAFYAVAPAGLLGDDIVLLLFQGGGKLGVDLFVMITGYMTIRSSFKSRSLLRVVLQTLFYSWSILLIFIAFDPSAVGGLKSIAKSLIPVISGEYWFVTAYVGLVLVSPFVGWLVRELGKDGVKKLLILLFVPLSLIPTFTHQSFICSELVWFVYLYILAGYIRLWGLPDIKRLTVLAILSVVAILAAALAVTLLVGARKMPFGGMNSCFMVVLAVACFRWFMRLDIGSNKAINTLASGAFAVYLIHDNPFVRGILWPCFGSVFAAGPAVVALIGIGTVVAIYLLCAMVDILRQRLLEAPFMCMLKEGKAGSLLDRFDAWMVL